LATFKLQDAIADLQKKFPEVCFKIVLANSEDIAGKLESREIDLAFFLGDDTVNGCKQIVIRRGYYCLIKPKKVQGDLRFAMTERRPETERARVLYEREHAEPLPLFAEIPSWDAIWTWAKAGVCGGLVPDFLINADSEGTKEIKILFPKVFPYEVKVMYPKTKSHDPLIADFIERVRSW
jgi:DNA-binding transcriptional LysR family regulator